MEIEELDKLLSKWKTDVDNMITNIVKLSELMSYQILSGSVFDDPNDSNAKEASDKVANVEILLQNVNLIREVIDEAIVQKANLPLFGKAKAIDRIAQMIQGPSIAMPAKEVSFERRGLLGEAEEVIKVKPVVLKKRMVKLFTRTKAYFFNVESIWEKMGPELSEYREKAEGLRDQLEAYGFGFCDEIEALVEKVDELELKLNTAPYAFMGGIQIELEPYENRVNEVLKKLKIKNQSLAFDIQSANNSLRQLKIFRRDCEEKCKKAGLNPAALPGTEELEQDLEMLSLFLGQKEYSTVSKGLGSWKTKLSQLTKLLESSVDELGKQEARRKAMGGEITKARSKFEELLSLRTTFLEIFSEVRAQISGREIKIPSTKQISQELKDLEEVFAHGRYDKVGPRLMNWFNHHARLTKEIRDGIEQIRKIAQQQNSLGDEIKAAAGELEVLMERRTECLQLFSHCRAELDDFHELAMPPKTKEISGSLRTLQERFASGRSGDVASGLMAWRQQLSRLMNETGQSIAHNRKLLEQKKQLRNTFAALKRKMIEYQERGLRVDKALSTFAKKSEEMVSGRTHLDYADRTIYAFSSRLEEDIYIFEH